MENLSYEALDVMKSWMLTYLAMMIILSSFPITLYLLKRELIAAPRATLYFAVITAGLSMLAYAIYPIKPSPLSFFELVSWVMVFILLMIYLHLLSKHQDEKII